MRKYKLVPVDPTEDMISANHCECGNAEERDGYIVTDYQSMLAAAPPASQDEELAEGVRELVAENLMCVGEFRDDHVLTRAMSMDIARAVLKMLERNQ